MVGLGVLPGGAFTSYAEGVSADGTVVVGESGSYSVFGDEAFRWTLGGGMVGLGDLPGGFFYSYAYDVSADGSVVVGWSDSASGNEAFRWTSGGGMVGLGDLPGGSFSSRAECVSADGAVVVGVSDSASGDEAFRWTAAGGMRSVRDILVNDYGLNLTGWTLGQTTGISSDGTTLVGFGTNPSGFTEAWIAVIPRDITVAATSRQGLTVYAGVLMMTGLLGIAYRQRRHGRAA
jgi:probable HAF family extracellular repeat protein